MAFTQALALSGAGGEGSGESTGEEGTGRPSGPRRVEQQALAQVLHNGRWASWCQRGTGQRDPAQPRVCSPALLYKHPQTSLILEKKKTLSNLPFLGPQQHGEVESCWEHVWGAHKPLKTTGLQGPCPSCAIPLGDTWPLPHSHFGSSPARPGVGGAGPEEYPDCAIGNPKSGC